MPWRYSRAATVIAVAALGKSGGAAQVKDILKRILHKNLPLLQARRSPFIAPGADAAEVPIGQSLAVLDDISGFFDGLWKSLSQLRVVSPFGECPL